MPKRVGEPAVAGVWRDPVPWGEGRYGLTRMNTSRSYETWQRARYMNTNECMAAYGVEMITGMPLIGIERKHLHGRGVVLLHLESLPLQHHREGPGLFGMTTNAR